MNPSTLAIIPARGGSTRLKDKNIYPLNGKPLIGYTIEAVLDSGLFENILLSTDSARIRDFASGYKGLHFHDRPSNFATERSTVVSAIVDLMKQADKTYEQVAYFLPTCPFRSAEDIKQGMKLSAQCDSVISTCYYDNPIQLAMVQGQDGLVLPVFDNLRSGLTNSKFIQKFVRPNGGFYISKWDMVIESGSFFNGLIKEVLLPKERSVDIDTLEDIKYAEALLDR